MGEDFSVNGRLQPKLSMRSKEVQLWRIVNTSARSGAFFIGPPPGFAWKQLAQDGVQFVNENYKDPLNCNENYQGPLNCNASFLLAPGNRADLLVKAPARRGATRCRAGSACGFPGAATHHQFGHSDVCRGYRARCT